HDGMLSVQTAVFTRCGANRVPLCGKSSGKSGLKQIDDLTPEQRDQLLEKLESHQAKNGISPLPDRSLFDALHDRGMIGSITNGPGDLGTNPVHMEGFGENAH
ncbi:MAG: hypothetical protein SH868_19515, partial [Bythopirellula sp.]|nr:hypothetical protein [Bythopirellula sp.]